MVDGRLIIDDPWYAAARRWPEAIAVVAPGRTLRYGDWARLVSGTARRLHALGVGPGSRVGLYLANGWRMLVVLPAVIRAGGVACPVSTREPPARVAALLRTAAAPVLVTDRPEPAGHPAPAVQVVAPEAVIGEADGAETVPPIEQERPATIVFTSGSTGVPKAALLSFGNHYFNARGSNENIALRPGDRWLLALPLYHVGGLGIVFRCLLAGATVVVPEAGLAAGMAVRRHGITHVSLVATQLRRLLCEPERPQGLKAVLLGGSAIPPALLRRAHTRGWPLHTTYGLTEMASQVTTTPPGATLDRLGTSGRLLPFRQLRLSEDGAIQVRGETRFLGYVEGAALHQPFDADGWFHTGDLGTLDAEGFLHVQGRADNLFISGGENIQPEEIERVLCSLDGIAQAVVVPVADAEFGRRPVAFVQRAAGAPPLEALADRLAPLLPGFKIPRAFYAWPEEAPRQGMKIDRAFFLRLFKF